MFTRNSLAWSPEQGEKQRLKRISAIVLPVFFVLATVITWKDVPPPERAELEKLPPSLAKFVKKKEKPKPVIKKEEKKVEPEKPPEPKIVEKPKPKPEPKIAKKPKPKIKATMSTAVKFFDGAYTLIAVSAMVHAFGFTH